MNLIATILLAQADENTPANREGQHMLFVCVSIAVLAVAALCSLPILSARGKRKKYHRLLIKYGKPDLVERLVNKVVWQGETGEQVLDSFGNPLAIDEEVYKEKKKQVWKYDSRGVNRYGLRIIIEDGLVTGWDKK